MLGRLFFVLGEARGFLFGLLGFSIFISLIESFAISLIMPFITLASDFSHFASNAFLAHAQAALGLSPPQLVLIFGLILIFFYLCRALLNGLYFHLLARLAKGSYHQLSTRVFLKFFKIPYEAFAAKRLSEIHKAITGEVHCFTTMLSSFLIMISEAFVLLMLYLLMLFINHQITLYLSIFMLFNALVLIKILSPIIKRAGADREEAQRGFFEILNTNLNNFKLIKLSTHEGLIAGLFASRSGVFARANISNDTLAALPRIYLENISFIILAALIALIVLVTGRDISALIPTISVFVLALYRLIPSINRIIGSYHDLLFYRSSLDVLHEILSQPEEELGGEELGFEREICLRDLGFAYRGRGAVFEGLNLVIKQGEKIALTGPSGGGKTTLADLIAGLLRPNSGEILIDGAVLGEAQLAAHRRRIGLIPQQIYLFDGSIAENIAFFSPIDEVKIKQLIEKCNLADFIASLPDGIHTQVGDGGRALSGGQAQRVAIARALYRDPQILILDEATSALDTASEARIMDELYRLAKGRTLIIIAHRTSTITRCDRIYRLEEGRLLVQAREDFAEAVAAEPLAQGGAQPVAAGSGA